MRKALAAKDRLRSKHIEQAREYVRLLEQKAGPVSAAIIGSVARGDFNAASDIDVLVVSDLLPESPLRRSELLYSVAIPLVEPKGFTTDEFLQLADKKNPLISDLAAHGIILVDRGPFARLLDRDCQPTHQDDAK